MGITAVMQSLLKQRFKKVTLEEKRRVVNNLLDLGYGVEDIGTIINKNAISKIVNQRNNPSN